MLEEVAGALPWPGEGHVAGNRAVGATALIDPWTDVMANRRGNNAYESIDRAVVGVQAGAHRVFEFARGENATREYKVLASLEHELTRNRTRLKWVLLRCRTPQIERTIVLGYEQLVARLIGRAPNDCLELVVSGPHRRGRLAFLRSVARDYAETINWSMNGVEETAPVCSAVEGLLIVSELHLLSRPIEDWFEKIAPMGMTAQVRRAVDDAYKESTVYGFDLEALGIAAKSAEPGSGVDDGGGDCWDEDAVLRQLRPILESALPRMEARERELLSRAWIRYSVGGFGSLRCMGAVDWLLVKGWSPRPVRSGPRTGQEPNLHQLRSRVFGYFKRFQECAQELGPAGLSDLIKGQPHDVNGDDLLEGGE